MQSPRSVFASPWPISAALATFAFVTCIALATPFASAEDELASEPYVVFVAHDEVHARCGPSGEYYRTDPLRHGQELEVYVETEDGWLGVRPPENSFCWVPESAVEVSGRDDTATVTEDRTVAWIGTHLGRARQYRWQVQLAEGEEVAIIGRSERDGPDGPQLWFRIVPPSGEFRWVHRDQTVDSPEALVAAVRRQRRDQDIQLMPVDRKDVRPAQHMTESTAMAASDPSPQQIDADGNAGRLDDSLALSRNASSRRTAGTPGERSTNLEPFRAKPPAASRSTPQPVASNQPPSFRNAPIPQREAASDADARAVPIATANGVEADDHSESAIGSGLQQDWRANAVRDSVNDRTAKAIQAPRSGDVSSRAAPTSATIATASFLGQPRLIEIGSDLDQAAPETSETAGDGNWVSGIARPSNVAQVAGISPMPAQTLSTTDSFGAPANRRHMVSRERIARVENEVRGADVEKLQLVLSRLMAQSASSEETRPLVKAAYQIARTSVDEVTAGRARLVAERAEQYQRVAERRHGTNSTIRSQSMVIPTGGESALNELQPFVSTSAAQQAQPHVAPRGGFPNGAGAFVETGFLVQVYSARTNSPPFALTDQSGNTVAYVTPAPGINLRTHLNSRISVAGNTGFLQGLNTPHILVTKAVRTQE